MNNSKPKQPASPGAVFFTIAFFIIIFLISKCSCSKNDEQTEQQSQQQIEQNDKDLLIKAYACAQVSVQERLKSPSTAEFPNTTDCVTKISDNTYVINSYVDSQNSYGAMLRTNFTCQITLTGNDTYTCDDIQLFEQ